MLLDNSALLAHWPLHSDTHDHSRLRHVTQAVEVELGFAGPHGQPHTAARFNGRNSLLQIAAHPALHMDSGEFTFAAWICTDETTDAVGDLCSKFDTKQRNGFHISVLTNSGVTSTAQANYRQLHFGIDAARLDENWTDCGRPGNAQFIAALAAIDGRLYAGTLETGANEAGHLWRYDGGQNWIDLGNPVGCNVVHSITQFQGSIYCGFGRFMTRGSDLGEELNTTPGGKVFCLEADGHWTDCGHPGHEGATPEAVPTTTYASGKADDVIALTVFDGALYGVSNHRAGVFKYEGGQSWRHVGLERRSLSLTIYRRRLYALINGGPVFCYAGGKEWTFCGHPAGSIQTYAAVTCAGHLYVGTWPECDVFRYDGGESWTKIGRVGWEREAMAMALYNGKAYLGTLPMANVWRMDDDQFTFLATLDHGDAALRRVWSMAVYDGKLFAGTLPSGRVKCIEAGKVATWDQGFPAGWHHVVAAKESQCLKLYVDGTNVATSSSFSAHEYLLNNDRPLQIGCGPYEQFDGLMSDVRLYSRALSADEVNRLPSFTNIVGPVPQ